MKEENPGQITFGLIKPDATVRGLEKEIYREISCNGMFVFRKKRLRLKPADVDFIYGHNKEREFYDSYVEYMTLYDCEPFLCRSTSENVDVISQLNELVGNLDPNIAHPSSIRGRWAIPDFFFPGCIQNLIHSSVNEERMIKESEYFFQN